MRDFRDRGVFITGGAGGIGFAMAEAFAAQGMRVVLSDVNEAALWKATNALRTNGADVLSLTHDVTDRSGWSDAVSAVEKFGKLHVICANAGRFPSGKPISEIEPSDWDAIIATNLTGVFNTVRALMPLVRAHGEGGHVVLTSSIAGVIAMTPLGEYTVAKYGIAGLGETLRVELAPDGIGVSILFPGTVRLPAGGLVGADGAPRGMAPASVARRVVQAIANNDFYIFTHPEYKPLLDARVRALQRSFGPSAEQDYREPEEALQRMWSTVAYPRGNE